MCALKYGKSELVKKPEYIKTEIPGFDDLFATGIPRGVNILVTGGPGTGKTIFCSQVLYNLMRAGHDCLYITFEELPRELVQHMSNFGWHAKVESMGELWKLSMEGKRSGTLIIRILDPFAIFETFVPEKGRFHIKKEELPSLIPGGVKPYSITVDSLSALATAFEGHPEKYRIYVDYLFKMFKELGATTFWVAETEEASGRYSIMGIAEFLADGVIVLYNSKIRDQRVRAIEVLKMRGVKHDSRIVPLDVSDRGLVILPARGIPEWQLAHGVRLEEIR